MFVNVAFKDVFYSERIVGRVGNRFAYFCANGVGQIRHEVKYVKSFFSKLRIRDFAIGGDYFLFAEGFVQGVDALHENTVACAVYVHIRLVRAAEQRNIFEQSYYFARNAQRHYGCDSAVPVHIRPYRQGNLLAQHGDLHLCDARHLDVTRFRSVQNDFQQVGQGVKGCVRFNVARGLLDLSVAQSVAQASGGNVGASRYVFAVVCSQRNSVCRKGQRG